jgi:hypothetical protein
MLSRVGEGAQQVELFPVVGVSGVKKGAITDATGIRQIENEETANPTSTARRDGMAPVKAFPLSVFLQYIYCEAKFIPAVSRNAIIGILIHNTIVKEGIDSLKWNITMVIIKRITPAGIAVDSALTLTLLVVVVPGFDMTTSMIEINEGD